jgi:hypothetical protein
MVFKAKKLHSDEKHGIRVMCTSIVLTTFSARTEVGRSHCVQNSFFDSSSFEMYALIIGCLKMIWIGGIKMHRWCKKRVSVVVKIGRMLLMVQLCNSKLLSWYELSTSKRLNTFGYATDLSMQLATAWTRVSEATLPSKMKAVPWDKDTYHSSEWAIWGEIIIDILGGIWLKEVARRLRKSLDKAFVDFFLHLVGSRSLPWE